MLPTPRPRVVPRRTTRSLPQGLAELDGLDQLDGLVGAPLSAEVLRDATDRVLAATTALVADLRGHPAPAPRGATAEAGGGR